MLSFKNRSIAATAAMFATVMTIAAAAPVGAETITVPVSYADLDLSSEAGVATLQHRIRDAADTICGRPAAFNRSAVGRCRHSVLTAAQADVRVAMANKTGVALAAK